MKNQKTNILIVGAGPYGLSLANYLAYQKKDFIIVGKSMELWREHTFDNMDLRSDVATSTIIHPENKYSFENYCAKNGHSIEDLKGMLPVTTFRHYLNWCEKSYDFKVQKDYVVKVETKNGKFTSKLKSGVKIESEKIVFATGVAHHLNIPEEIKSNAKKSGSKKLKILHSYDTAGIAKLKKKNVLVIGAGQSAAESIDVLLQNSNSVDWHSRQKPIFFKEPLNIPKWLFNIIVYSAWVVRAIPPAISKRLLSIFSATTITPNFQPMMEKLNQLKDLPDLSRYDIIITATGYRYDIRTMDFIGKSILSQLKLRKQMPYVNSAFETSIKGMHFIGPIIEQYFGPAMKFMIGAHYAAPKLSSRL